MKVGAQISNSWTKLSAPSNSSGPLVAHVYDNDMGREEEGRTFTTMTTTYYLSFNSWPY